MYRNLALAALTVLLASCGSGTSGLSGTGSREVLQLTTPTLPVAYVEENFLADLQVTGGINPYTLRVVSGTLPPGVTLKGTRLAGRPSKEGRYEFTVEATDATLSTRSRTYAVNVGTLPPLAVAPDLPRGATEFRADTRVPLTINYPRGARAVRFQWRLPEGARVTGVQPGDGKPILLWKQTGQMLTLDAGFPNAPVTGGRVALLALSFDKPTRLDASQVGFEARDAEGKAVASKAIPAERGTTPAPGAKPAQPGTTPEGEGTDTPGQETAPDGQDGETGTPPAPEDTAPEDTAPEGTEPADTQSEGTESTDTESETTAPETTEPETTEPEGTAPADTTTDGEAADTETEPEGQATPAEPQDPGQQEDGQ